MPKFFLIVNPMSGHKKGHSILEKVKGIFNNTDIELIVAVTTHKNHPFELANTRSLEGFDAICVIGGDGTFHEVLNGMLKRPDKKRLPLGFIPGGTGNAFMHDMGCLDPVEATHHILSNRLGKMDVFEIKSKNETIYSFNILGWGVPVAVNVLAEKMRWIGGQRYNIASVVEVLKNKTSHVKFIIDGKEIEDECGFFLACNTMYTGNGMKMAPEAKIDDGYIDILIAKKIGRLKLLSLFAKVFKGNHISDPAISYFRAKEFSIITSSNDLLNIDGQNLGSTPIHAKVIPDQVDIYK